jgi:spermidine synthase
VFHVKHSSPPQTPLLAPLSADLALSLHPDQPERCASSPFQEIRSGHSPSLGDYYRLDGDLMASTLDAFVIHESLVHIPALEHPAPRRALILGGGDGASARELLRHRSIEYILIAELDPAVVAHIRQHLPRLPDGAFDDPRVELRYGDAARTLAQLEAQPAFDLILFDLCAVDNPACAHLHTADFFRACAARLTPGGSLHVQLGSPFFHGPQIRATWAALAQVFPDCRPALISLPLYGGPWLLASAGPVRPQAHLNLLATRLAQALDAPQALRYYSPAVHLAARALPPYVLQHLTLHTCT